MDDYIKIRSKQQRKELILIIFFAAFLIIGVIFDITILCFHGKHIIELPNLDSFSMALLQIQGTIITLAFAVIAFISGNNSDTYLGISVTHYFLEERPVLWTQKRITIASILVLAGCIGAHIFKAYNLVIGGSFSQLFLIILAVSDIYLAFGNRFDRHREFESYYRYMMKPGNRKKIISMVENLSDEWQSIKDIATPTFEKYVELFILGENALNVERGLVDITALKDFRISIIKRCLTSLNKSEQTMGLKFLKTEYENVRTQVRDGVVCNESFDLFYELSHEIYQTFKELGTEDLARIGRNEGFVMDILMVADNIKAESEIKGDVSSEGLFSFRNSRYQPSLDVCELINFESGLGYLIRRKREEERRFDLEYWGSILYPYSSFFAFEHVENSNMAGEISHLPQWWGQVLFNYASGLLINHCNDLIKNYYYKNRTYYGKMSFAEQDTFLSIYLYNYVLAFANGQADDAVKQEYRDLIQSEEAAHAIRGFLDYLSDYHECPSLDRIKNIGSELNRHPLLETVGRISHVPDLTEIARSYHLFIVLYLAWQMGDPSIIDEKLPLDTYLGYIQVSDDGKSYYKDAHSMIKQFYQLVDGINKKSIEEDIDGMLRSFYTSMRRRYKEQEISNAERDNLELTPEAIGELEETVSKILTDKTIEKFKSLHGKYVRGTNPINEEVALPPFIAPTQFFKKAEIVKYSVNSIDSGIYVWMHNCLVKNKFLDIASAIDREQFVTLLRRYDILAGSSVRLSLLRYRYGREVAELIDSKIMIDINIDGVLLLDSSKINLQIHEIHASVRTVEMSDVEYEKVNDGNYRYTYVVGYPITFTEEEFKKFLADSMKKVVLKADLTLKTRQGEQVGVFVNNPYREF